MNSADAIITLYHSLPIAEQERVKNYLGARHATTKQNASQKRQERIKALAVKEIKSYQNQNR